jgi:hypothetical protein
VFIKFPLAASISSAAASLHDDAVKQKRRPAGLLSRFERDGLGGQQYEMAEGLKTSRRPDGGVLSTLSATLGA